MVRPIKKEDLAQIKKWTKDRIIQDITNDVSNIGYIEDGVAAGFLFTTNSSTAFIEHLIANPLVSSEIRDIALDEIVTVIANHAWELGFSNLIGVTSNQSVVRRAVKLGFIEETEKYTVVNLDLENN